MRIPERANLTSSFRRANLIIAVMPALLLATLLEVPLSLLNISPFSPSTVASYRLIRPFLHPEAWVGEICSRYRVKFFESNIPVALESL